MSPANDSPAAPEPAGDFGMTLEPFGLFETWMAQATTHEPNDPNAMALATVDAQGLPNARMVLLKGIDPAGAEGRGFVFYTNTHSTKGRELSASGKAALNFHWKSLRRQVRVRGLISSVGADEADAYFASRSRGSQLGAWASQQSRPLESRAVLEAAVEQATQRFAVGAVPRPPHWPGFRLTPVEIEFWHDRPFRLHDRLVFRRPQTTDAGGMPSWDKAAAWTRTRLYP